MIEVRKPAMCKVYPEIRNPITLHFYSPEEKIPDDISVKIVITEDGYFEFAYYNNYDGKWYLEWTDERIVFDVIAWATFYPEWVVPERGEA